MAGAVLVLGGVGGIVAHASTLAPPGIGESVASAIAAGLFFQFAFTRSITRIERLSSIVGIFVFAAYLARWLVDLETLRPLQMILDWCELFAGFGLIGEAVRLNRRLGAAPPQ